MGLLDNFNMDDPKSMGLLQAGLSMLGNSGPSTMPTSFGQIFAQGANAGLGTMAQMKKQKADEEREKQMQEMRVMQLQEMRQQMATRDTALNQQNAILSAARQAMQSPEQQAASLPGGPSVGNAARIPQMQGGFDQDSFIQKVMGIDPIKGLALQKDMAKQRPKVDTTPRVAMGADGKPFTYVLDEAGTMKRLDGVLPRDEFKTMNLGGKEIAYNPFALQAGQEFQRTQTPDSLASNGLARERLSFDKGQALAPKFNAQAGGFVSGPDQNNPNGRITPLAGFGGNNKPLPPAALKMQQAELDAIGIASGIQSDLTRIEGQIESGKLGFGPVENLVSQGLNMAGRSTENSRNFASFKSTLEKLRNDSLRLNTGVQTDGDAQRAWNELFANITDQGVVQQRLAEIKKINERAVTLRQMNVDSIRGNYGHDPLDTSGYSGGAVGQPARRYNPVTGKIE